MKTTSIVCDECGKEMVIESNYPHRWGLELSCKDFGINKSGFAYAINSPPILDRPFHFCNEDCLKNWMYSDHWRKEVYQNTVNQT